MLEKRLVQRRKEMEFLVHMMEISPEMVATVFHKGFRFASPATMDQLLSLEADEFPDWHDLTHAVHMEPWTRPLVAIVQKHAMGDWFLTVAAALEYLNTKPDASQSAEEDEDSDDADEPMDEEEREAKAREDAGAEWMVEQGFDRKE